ncbi:helix-turn-helix domain-containing protein [Microbacterium profundi]|uniref:helix-turn-helix transcriptional regulator n=1 Tax=Microbacterium profundi TaxID=450380 RepID=UPI001F446FD1|nr:helix-turn-helix domain-containing protein [Microbacterium profundi]MCE7483367.1 helix-turn-helix domain-containing protein [Microbacterium profundi]
MEQQERDRGRHAALASDMRRQVLALLLASDRPIDAVAVAGGIGLHVTTARFHLEQLERAGLVRRAVERAGQRGRPRILFIAAPGAREDGAQRELSEVLASALAEDADGGRARAIRAGEEWSSNYDDELPAMGDRSAVPLVRLLERLGFDPQLKSPESMIDLHACPFRDEARRNPNVICSVHLGLIRGAARSLGHDAEDAGIRPFVAPELCVVDLLGGWASTPRPDQQGPTDRSEVSSRPDVTGEQDD